MLQNGHFFLREAIIRRHILTAMAIQPGLKSKRERSASDGCRTRIRKNEMRGRLLRGVIPGVNGDMSFSNRETRCFSHLARSILFSEPDRHKPLLWAAISFNGPIFGSGLRMSSLNRGTPITPTSN